jgi:propanol-preferring alcohol dehydrogenase
MDMMRAWSAGEDAGDLEQGTKPVPAPGTGEALVKVLACGICRTDLHVIDRELPVHRANVTPGHQVIGRVVSVGEGVTTLREGDHVGIAWLRYTCGVCQWCRSGRENLCPNARFTGWDEDGGFAEYALAPEAFSYVLPREVDPVDTAPLLCAGIIGYRALVRAELPPGGRLGIYGFGSSAHITAAIAQASGAEIYAMSRGAANRDLATRLGAVFVGGEDEMPPMPLDSAIVFAPAGNLVPAALRATTRGGTVVLAGIHMSDIPAMSYEDDLFYERDLRTVTANTRADGAALLRLAGRLQVHPDVTVYDFDHLADGLDDLRAGRASGSLVVSMA